jgi:type I restriction enzyme S subunit
MNSTEYVLPNIKADFVPNNYSLCQDGDIAFADASEDTNDVAKCVEFCNCGSKKIVCGLHTIHGRDKLNITITGFKGYAFSSKLFRHQVRRLAQGTKVFSVSPKTFNYIYISIPSKQEQRKITNILSLIEQKVVCEKQLLEKYEAQKRYLLKNMFV